MWAAEKWGKNHSRCVWGNPPEARKILKDSIVPMEPYSEDYIHGVCMHVKTGTCVSVGSSVKTDMSGCLYWGACYSP